MKVEVVFIILHYGDPNLTDRAIKSVLGLDGVLNSRIVVVENGPNNSGDFELKLRYSEIDIVDVIVSDVNLGFSKGNNLGFEYAKEEFDADFFVIMNNDILFPDKRFIKRIFSAYTDRPFFVAGPDVFVPQWKYHSSPLKRGIPQITDIDNEIKKNEYIIKECTKKNSFDIRKKYWKEIVLSNNCFYKLGISVKRIILGERQKGWSDKNESLVVLQGSCLIFDKRFIGSNDKVFSPETFLYAEEYLLSRKCQKEGWNMEYFPEITVYHTCQGSLKKYSPHYSAYCEKLKKSAETSIESLNIAKQAFKES